jgi:hypothetical protein
MDQEYSCNKCDGTGMYKIHHFDECKVLCPKCTGKGRLNWIDNIFKNPKIDEKLLFVNFLVDYLEKSTKAYKEGIHAGNSYNSAFLSAVQHELEKFKEKNIIDNYQIRTATYNHSSDRVSYDIQPVFCESIELYAILLK